MQNSKILLETSLARVEADESRHVGFRRSACRVVNVDDDFGVRQRPRDDHNDVRVAFLHPENASEHQTQYFTTLHPNFDCTCSFPNFFISHVSVIKR